MKKELKSGILSADKSADGRPTVGGVNVIAVLLKATILIFSMFCRQSLVAFGNLINTSTESRLHFEELCFLKAALASSQFDNPLIIYTLSS